MSDNTDEEHLDNPTEPTSGPPDEIIPTKETETINPNQESENMEVHHHPDLHHKPKKWKEYFLEFLMIFLAVTLGFFAENIRESFTKHEREERLMVMMVEDLKTDNNKLDSAIIKNNIQQNNLDTLRALVYASAKTELPETSIKKMYYLYRVYSGYNIFFSPTQRTLNVFEKNDAFSLLRKQEVSDSIVDYSENNTKLLKQADACHEFQFKALDVGETIFNHEYLETLKTRDSAEAFWKSTQKFQLMTQDKQTLQLYGNKLYVAEKVLSNYINLLVKQKGREEKLSALIKKKYHLETE